MKDQLGFIRLCFFNCGFPCEQSDVEAGQGWEVESRYKSMYEDSINPFAAFSTKVGSRHMLAAA